MSLALLCLLSLPCTLSAQEVKTDGTVTDSNRKPIVGVVLSASDGRQLGETDQSGYFRIATLPRDGKIILSHPDYLSAEVFAQTGANAFSMERNPLDESIDVGHGLRSRRELTSSISTVGGDRLTRSSALYPAQALYGLIPGLIVEDKTGEFGTFNPNMFIRGRATMGAASNTPLILIDGWERSLDDVVLEDIASVAVLKDASATAIYGMKGANGVILVDTKRGHDGRIRFNVNLEQGFQTPYRVADFVSSGEFAQYYNQALLNDGQSARYSADDIAGFKAGNSPYYPDNQWQEQLVRSAVPATAVKVSADGGNKIARYFVSAGYTRNQGLFEQGVKESDKYTTRAALDKINFRTNLDIVAIDNFDLRVDVSGQILESNTPYNTSTNIWNMLYRYPQNEFPMYLPNGRLGGTSAYQANPMGYINHSGYKHATNRVVNSSLSGAYHFQGALKGLSIGARYAYDNIWHTVQSFSKKFAVQEILGQDPDGTPLYSDLLGQDTQLSYSIGNDAQVRHEHFEAFLRYKLFGRTDIHSLDAMAVYHQDKQYTNSAEPYGTQYLAARLNYAYKQRYLADFSVSYSGSEEFAEGNRFEWFPALSLGWILSEEKFLKDSKTVDFLKLRASAGLVGNANMGENNRFSYRYTTNGQTGNYYFGTTPTLSYGRKPGTLPNPNVRAEKSLKVDVAVEAQLWNSLFVSANYFYENRYDILISMAGQVSSILGATAPNINSGSTATHGIELQVDYTKRLGRDWSLFTNLNLLYFKDKVLEMVEAPVPANSAYQYHTGYSVGSNLGLIALGLFQSQQEIDESPRQTFSAVQPGDIKYKDVNGDGVIDNFDRVHDDGYSIPNLNVGWTIGVQWKGFDLSALLHLTAGNDIYLGDAPNLFWSLRGDSKRVSTWVADRVPWTEQTASRATYPRLTTSTDANNYQRSNFWIISGEQLRMRKLELGWTMPERISRKLAMTKFRVYLRAENLFSLDNLKFVDRAAMGSDPLLRSFYIGLNVNF